MWKVIFYLFTISTLSDQDITKSIKIEGKVKAKIINAQTGNLLISTSKAPYGLNSKAQDTIWKRKKLKKIDLSSYLHRISKFRSYYS